MSPVAHGVTCEIRFRYGGTQLINDSPEWRWTDTGDTHDIVAYRVRP